MAEFKAILLEQHGATAVVRLNRVEKHNAISRQMADELVRCLDALDSDPDVRVIVLTGAGDKAFCAGADMAEAALGRYEDSDADAPPIEGGRDWAAQAAVQLVRASKPVIAAVNGVAAGAGMSLSLACDMRVGSENTRFKTVFIERNLSPDSGMSFFLPRIVGVSRAADLIYTSRMVLADEAYRMGLLDRLVAHDNLVEEAVALANQMTQWPPLALRSAKRVLQHNVEAKLEDALQYELYGLSFGRKATNDAKESRRAFVEKRVPKYTGT